MHNSVTAKTVADRLLADLKAGAIPKIDIDVIRAAIRKELGEPDNYEIDDHLESETTRRVVMGV